MQRAVRPQIFRAYVKYNEYLSLFHREFRFTKFYLYQRMHLFLSYTKIT